MFRMNWLVGDLFDAASLTGSFFLTLVATADCYMGLEPIFFILSHDYVAVSELSSGSP